DEALSTAVTNARGAVAAFVESHASAVIAQGVGTLTGAGVHQASADVVNALASVQRKYIENINADPIIVACLTAFDRSELNQAGAGSFNTQLVTSCQSALPQIVRLQADVLRARLIDGQGSLLHGCMAALDAAGSADATVKAAAHKLLDFCSTNFMNTLKTQAEV